MSQNNTALLIRLASCSLLAAIFMAAAPGFAVDAPATNRLALADATAIALEQGLILRASGFEREAVQWQSNHPATCGYCNPATKTPDHMNLRAGLQ